MILKLIRRFVGKSFRLLKFFWRVNVTKTIVINFKTQKLTDAIKFPILLFGKVQLHSLTGKIIIDAPIKTGMIKIGYKWWDLWPSSFLPTQIWTSGTCVFHGRATISGGVGLFIQAPSAVLEIGECCAIGGGTFLKSRNYLAIGDYTRITGDCVIMDSNMHYVKNIETGVIAKPWGKIVIGQYCWINAHTVINKGAVIPDYTITARNSFINKDYTEYGTSLFLAGAPAKVKSANVQRIFDRDKEIELGKFFRDFPNKDVFNDEPGLFVDKCFEL